MILRKDTSKLKCLYLRPAPPPWDPPPPNDLPPPPEDLDPPLERLVPPPKRPPPNEDFLGELTLGDFLVIGPGDV